MKLFKNIPEELKELAQWVCHRIRYLSTLLQAPAKAGIPKTWTRFEDAVNAYDKGGYDGIGFEFNPVTFYTHRAFYAGNAEY